MLAESKKVVRQILDQSIATVATHRWSKPAGSLLILAYHRVLPASFRDLDIVEPGMFVYTSTFEAHLQMLRQDFDIVCLSDWLRARAQGHTQPKRACAITFDDGWRDNFEFAFPLLKKYEAPATIFVVAGMAGTTKQFWPERLARILRHASDLDVGQPGAGITWVEQLLIDTQIPRKELTSCQISELIKIAKQWSDEQISQYLDDVESKIERLPPLQEPDVLDWTQLRQMAATGLISVGSHTTNHIRLTSDVDSKTVHQEVVGSKALIEQELSAPVDLFCYPNGDVSKDAEQVVSQTYIGACTTEFGWNRPNADSCRLRRITIHEGRTHSKSAFLARISGWLG